MFDSGSASMVASSMLVVLEAIRLLSNDHRARVFYHNFRNQGVIDLHCHIISTKQCDIRSTAFLIVRVSISFHILLSMSLLAQQVFDRLPPDYLENSQMCKGDEERGDSTIL